MVLLNRWKEGELFNETGEKAKNEIDKQPKNIGWLLQEYKVFNPKAVFGILSMSFHFVQVFLIITFIR